jgi:hypothetical protein
VVVHEVHRSAWKPRPWLGWYRIPLRCLGTVTCPATIICDPPSLPENQTPTQQFRWIDKGRESVLGAIDRPKLQAHTGGPFENRAHKKGFAMLRWAPLFRSSCSELVPAPSGTAKWNEHPSGKRRATQTAVRRAD